MRHLRLVAAAVLCGLVVAGVALGSPPRSTLPAGVRSWHGMRIRSLDPPSADLAAARPGYTDPLRPAPRRSLYTRLSNERTTSRWANVSRTTPILFRPDPRSRRVGKLRFYTEDGFPEVYLLLRSHADRQGREWVELRVPGRPNGRTGWVRRGSLGRFHVTHQQIVVNRRRLRMFLFREGRLIWSAPVGVGKSQSPTPSGYFWIRERFKILDRASGYWPYAFGTADYSTLSDWPGGGVVGIHGPYHEPNLIPGRPSHGCIRLHKADDAWLARHISLGTPLRVR